MLPVSFICFRNEPSNNLTSYLHVIRILVARVKKKNLKSSTSEMPAFQKGWNEYPSHKGYYTYLVPQSSEQYVKILIECPKCLNFHWDLSSPFVLSKFNLKMIQNLFSKKTKKLQTLLGLIRSDRCSRPTGLRTSNSSTVVTTPWQEMSEKHCCLIFRHVYWGFKIKLKKKNWKKQKGKKKALWTLKTDFSLLRKC